jgi:hypothetical protein
MGSAGASIFGGGRSNYVDLGGNQRGAHKTAELFLLVLPEIKRAGMLIIIAVRRAEILLTLTRNTCECKLCLTTLVLAPLRNNLSRHLQGSVEGDSFINFAWTPRQE